jgi:8-oxo-dGTP diphosphatase
MLDLLSVIVWFSSKRGSRLSSTNIKIARPSIDVVAAVISRKHRGVFEVLIFQRAQRDSGAGNWEFPGGKVEPGETDAEALHREILEELSIEVHVIAKVAESKHQYPNINIHLKAYLCEPIERDFESNIVLTDHQAFRWVDRAQIEKVVLSPADVPLASDIFSALEKKVPAKSSGTSKV